MSVVQQHTEREIRLYVYGLEVLGMRCCSFRAFVVVFWERCFIPPRASKSLRESNVSRWREGKMHRGIGGGGD